MNEYSLLPILIDCQEQQLRKRIPFNGASPNATLSRVRQVLEPLRALRHEHVEAVHEVHFDPPKECFLLCEALQGESLVELLTRERRLPLETVRSITRQAASALTAAHNLGIMHGNLSPHAIMVQKTDADGSLIVKVRDFCLGQALVDNLFGALGYLAPEQVEPKSPRPEPTPLSDQFALAVVAFEMLAGMRAFPGDTLGATCQRLFQDPLHFQIQNVNKKESARVIAVLHKAMSRLPAERFASLNEFVAALESRLTVSRTSWAEARYSGAQRAQLELVPSRARELLGAAPPLPVPVDLPRQGHEAPTMTLMRFSNEQSATMPMVNRLELRVNVQTNVANHIDNRPDVYRPRNKIARWPNLTPQQQQILIVILLGMCISAGFLLIFAGGQRSSPPAASSSPTALATHSAVSAEQQNPIVSLVPPPASAVAKVSSRLVGEPAVEYVTPKKPPHRKVNAYCGQSSTLALSINRQIDECTSTLKGERDIELTLPFELTNGRLAFATDLQPAGSPQLIQCLRGLVAKLRKTEYGTVPPTGTVLHCSIK